MWAFRRISTWQRAGVTNALVALAVRLDISMAVFYCVGVGGEGVHP